MISTFDFITRYWWLLVMALVALPFISSYLVKDRQNWVKTGAETLTTIIAVFLAVVLAVAQTKYDRATERLEDAFSIVEGSEHATAMIINRVFSILEPGVYVASLTADDSTALIRSRVDASLALLKSRDALLQLLSQDLPLSAQVTTNPTLLKNLSARVVNAFIQSHDNYEIWRRQFHSFASKRDNESARFDSPMDREIISMFRTVESIDHLRMLACSAKKCLGVGGKKEEIAACVEIQKDITTFEEILRFSQNRMGCKARFYWHVPTD